MKDNCETNDCRKEKRGCKGCYYEDKNIDKEKINEKECYMVQQDDEYSNWYVCSNCKNDFYWGEEPEDIKNSNVKYCPFCGCKIKEIVYMEDDESEE